MKHLPHLEHEAAVELHDARAILLFDYYGNRSRQVDDMLDRNPDSKVIVFLTRNHNHISQHSVFEKMQNRNPIYVVTNDIPAMKIPSTVQVQGMSHGDIVELPNGITVKAYGAADNAVAYLVTYGDESIFYGGELTQKALTHLAEEVDSISLAFIPDSAASLPAAVKVGEIVKIKEG